MKVSTAPELMEGFANATAELQHACRYLAAFVAEVGEDEAYKQSQVKDPTCTRKIFDRMLELGRSPTSRSLNEYLSLGLDMVEARLIRPKNQ